MDRLDVRSIQAAARINYLTYYYCWIEFSPRYKCSTAELFAAYTALGYRPQAATIPSAARSSFPDQSSQRSLTSGLYFRIYHIYNAVKTT